MVSDGKLRHVHYSIIEDGGFAGFGQGVEWCVTGLDRNWAYNPICRAAAALDLPPFPIMRRPSRAAFAARLFLFLKCSASPARLRGRSIVQCEGVIMFHFRGFGLRG